jgi:hypothetical protein
LAAHRGNGSRVEGASARREVPPAAPGPRDVRASKSKEPARSTRAEGQTAAKGRVDYRKVSDDQILEM